MWGHSVQRRLQHYTLRFFTRQGPYQLSSQIWMKNICKKATRQEFNWRVFFLCFDYFKKVAMVTVQYLHLYNFLVPASRSFWILRFLAFIWCMMLLVLPPVRVTPKISHFLGLCCYTICCLNPFGTCLEFLLNIRAGHSTTVCVLQQPYNQQSPCSATPLWKQRFDIGSTI